MDLYQIFPQSANLNILKIPETGKKEDREGWTQGQKDRREVRHTSLNTRKT